ncbi:MAG: lysine-sensitive aspartokinase 3, partial [Planctomycetota bacterium]
KGSTLSFYEEIFIISIFANVAFLFQKFFKFGFHTKKRMVFGFYEVYILSKVQKMIVMKFGGTSLADRKRIETVFQLVKKRHSENPVVVVSAHSGVTDMLIEAAKNAVSKREVDIQPIRERHEKLLGDLGLERELIFHELQELHDLLRGIQLVRELTARSMDYVMSFGERMSSKIVAAYFNKKGIPAIALNAYDIGLETDSNFGRARHLTESELLIAQNIRQYENKIPIVTGFLGKNKEGEITTLGRSGSDYTASILGSALQAREIQIYTDVDGIMTADPRVVPNAASITRMSFEEASELAYYGAKVIHPSTMLPAVKKNIPIRVLNTYNPDHPGTLIVKEAETTEGIAKAVAYKRNIILINIVSTHMLQQYGFMARVFKVFAKHKIVLDMIATSEISVSMTTDSDKNLEEAKKELEEFGNVSIERKKAILCVVGEGLREHVGIGKKIFSALGDGNINVEMISQGATKINISLLVDEDHVFQAVRLLHETLFEK